MNAAGKLFPWFVVSVAALYLAYEARMPHDAPPDFQLRRFAAIPVQEGGRIMPFDTFARTKLMQLSHRQTARLESVDAVGAVATRSVPAAEWALDMLTLRSRDDDKDKSRAKSYYVFRIDNEQLLDFLKLKPSREHGFLFTYGDFVGKKQFWEQINQLTAKGGPAKDDLFENKLADLGRKLEVIARLAEFGMPNLAPPTLAGGDNLADREWLSFRRMLDEIDAGNDSAAFAHIEKLVEAYGDNSPSRFNLALEKYFDELERTNPDLVRKNRLEVFFNNFAPYYQCTLIFCAALVLAIGSWVVWSRPLRLSAFALSVLAMIVYTWTLYVRIRLSGYAPVTNLYSSAVFIGWGCALLCLGLELILKNGIGTAVAAVTSIMALIVAHNLLDGDSMGKVVAVLESNFWLSTHVICITKGYVATFVAGFLGIVYVLMGRFTDKLRGQAGIDLGKVIYGVVCFAMFLSFVGTVLGGIWADQSWGRFWGWDPKENGALLIVIWNAIILHARWAGLVKTRGVAQLAIAGNIVTAWSWFGTNLLGVGLHSYGFMKGAMYWLGAFAVTQIIIICLAIPAQSGWRSFRPQPPRERPPEPASPSPEAG